MKDAFMVFPLIRQNGKSRVKVFSVILYIYKQEQQLVTTQGYHCIDILNNGILIFVGRRWKNTLFMFSGYSYVEKCVEN